MVLINQVTFCQVIVMNPNLLKDEQMLCNYDNGMINVLSYGFYCGFMSLLVVIGGSFINITLLIMFCLICQLKQVRSLLRSNRNQENH